MSSIIEGLEFRLDRRVHVRDREQPLARLCGDLQNRVVDIMTDYDLHQAGGERVKFQPGGACSRAWGDGCGMWDLQDLFYLANGAQSQLPG